LHNRLEVETAIAKLKYKSSGSDQFLAELIQAGGKTLLSQIHKLINIIWNQEELTDQGKSIIIPIFKTGIKLTAVIIMGYHCYQLQTTFFPNILLSRSSPYIYR
jgi:hypothetical protein